MEPMGGMRCCGVLSVVFKNLEMHIPPRYWFNQISGQPPAIKQGRKDLVRYEGDKDYGEPPSTRPARTAQSTICCLVLNPSFLWTADTAFRTVSPLLFRISPISW